MAISVHIHLADSYISTAASSAFNYISPVIVEPGCQYIVDLRRSAFELLSKDVSLYINAVLVRMSHNIIYIVLYYIT